MYHKIPIGIRNTKKNIFKMSTQPSDLEGLDDGATSPIVVKNLTKKLKGTASVFVITMLFRGTSQT